MTDERLRADRLRAGQVPRQGLLGVIEAGDPAGGEVVQLYRRA
jgi:hypothetical protein